MAWKGVHLTRSASVSLDRGRIKVKQEEGGPVHLPIEDVAYLVLDVPHATLSTDVIAACMDSGVAIISTDKRHTPNGVMLPFHTHHRQAEIAALQISVSEPFRKRCWQAVVARKIENQAAHLQQLGRNDHRAVLAMAGRVKSGDPENIEARAARAYWSALFDDFVRASEQDLRNKLLNYGYAVIRAGVARALVAYGLLPCFGLHHASATNAFNLADDLVEPFRPFVDSLAHHRAAGRDKDSDLGIDDRRAMASVLLENCSFEGGQMHLLHACEGVAMSLVRAMQEAKPSLLSLPVLTSDNGEAS